MRDLRFVWYVGQLVASVPVGDVVDQAGFGIALRFQPATKAFHRGEFASHGRRLQSGIVEMHEEATDEFSIESRAFA